MNRVRCAVGWSATGKNLINKLVAREIDAFEPKTNWGKQLKGYSTLSVCLPMPDATACHALR